MRGINRAVRLGAVLIVVCTVIAVGIGAPGGALIVVIAAPPAQGDACQLMAQEVVTAARAACGTLGTNTACYGHESVAPTFVNAAQPIKDTLTTQGSIVDLAQLAALKTSVADAASKSWGIATLNIQADLPADVPGVRAVLFGDASIKTLVKGDPTAIKTLPTKTFDELPVTLRAGASTNFPQVTRMAATQTGQADGRNAKSTWVRVRLDNAVGWAPADFVRIEGDIAALPERNDLDILPDFLYPAPMQAFALESAPLPAKVAANTCLQTASGLLLQLDGEKSVNLLVNGVNLNFAKATILAQAKAKDNLSLMVITGSVTVKSFGGEMELLAGESIKIRLGGADGLIAAAAPRQKAGVPFGAVIGAPLSILTGTAPCMAGLLTSDKRIAARSGPGEKEFTSLFYLQPEQFYTVNGWNTDSASKSWWRLTNATKQDNWVPQEAVRTIGACDAVAKADPGIFEASEGGVAGVPGGGGFAPATKMVFNTDVSNDQLVGTCAMGPLNYCSHLVALSPRGSGLSYKGQEVKVYSLSRSRENVYAYNGRNGTGDGKIKLVLVFTSPTTFTMTQTLILDAEPSCQHVNVLTGTVR